ncbi:SDR family NAD(P)-dependent oxidoreductase [Sorangium sp. So ce1078]|uniref:MBL fold metallo-hydrolase n=1 Tax=Sorangium sp. So ce1078 TaxID=3133329 RepID=UPI003F6112E6
MSDMQGRVCVITGGTAGIGRATALALAKLGATVVILGRSRERGEQARAELAEESGKSTTRRCGSSFGSGAMERQHMNPEQAVQAYVVLGARAFFAMHWGTFKLTQKPLDELPVHLASEWSKRGLHEARRRVLAVGETAQVRRRSEGRRGCWS